MDTETEVLIQESLGHFIADRTAFVIAHRLSTIRDTDRIVVMEGGEIIEEGGHHELLGRGGKYATLWASQSQADTVPDVSATDD